MPDRPEARDRLQQAFLRLQPAFLPCSNPYYNETLRYAERYYNACNMRGLGRTGEGFLPEELHFQGMSRFQDKTRLLIQRLAILRRVHPHAMGLGLFDEGH